MCVCMCVTKVNTVAAGQVGKYKQLQTALKSNNWSSCYPKFGILCKMVVLELAAGVAITLFM